MKHRKSFYVLDFFVTRERDNVTRFKTRNDVTELMVSKHPSELWSITFRMFK